MFESSGSKSGIACRGQLRHSTTIQSEPPFEELDRRHVALWANLVFAAREQAQIELLMEFLETLRERLCLAHRNPLIIFAMQD